MNKKAAIIAGVAIVGLVGSFALSSKKGVTPENNVAAESTMTITHNLGETKVEKNPERVVVFDIPTLDTMEALGIDNVVGVPTSTYPENLSKYESDKYKKVGTVKEVDLEAIKSADPDLIIIGGRQADYYDQLNEIAPTISVSKDNADYVGSVKENVNTIAELFEVEEKASEELTKVEDRLNEVKKLVDGKEALTVMVNEGNLSVYSDKSRFALLNQGLGFISADKTIDDSTHGQTVTFEYLAEQNPEYLIVLDRGAATGGESTAESVLNNDIVKSMDAYKNGKIIYLDAYTWYINDGGLNSINIMIDDIANAIK
ncbi:siderophore ABC transporter substrate-binding protein [Romboutsia ilealis]|uniref:Siderophore ABC transporter substrate-binding protein n=1 Tax=Romboutsia faecis TaxID=2764597 RepID=A0ABR7JLE1_9FIRM|nr:siderophore ABC transporter substrate-binding protein [Romboutsia faecis]MBC5995729.1 siderophore ABC transporter substrate-binding protein [Romboutsia faecis]MRN23930.1 siderophore ABC transporter substrate-binding protein [Romboutsia ilealis]